MEPSTILDFETLGELLTFCDAADLRQLIDTFFSITEQRLIQAKGALDENRPEGVAMAFHALRSSIGSLGAVRLMPLASEAEDMANAGRLDGLPELVHRFEQEFEATRQALEAVHANPDLVRRTTGTDPS